MTSLYKKKNPVVETEISSFYWTHLNMETESSFWNVVLNKIEDNE
jgi:hypothetical protein